MSKLGIVKEFCKDNDILLISTSTNGDKIAFYLMSLYLNDITRPINNRLTITEQNILAHIIDFSIENGSVSENKAKYDLLINFLVKKKAVKSKAIFNTNKTNLVNKGYLLDGLKRNSVSIPEKMLKAFAHGNINIFISRS